MARTFRPWAFLAVAWSLNACLNAFYIAPAPVFLDIQASLGIANAEAGLLISIYLLSIMLFQVPAGYVSDRVSPGRTIPAFSVAVVVLSTGMFVIPRFDVLLALRFLAGIAVAFVFAPSAFLVSRAFPRSTGRAVGLYLSCAPAGVALGNLLGPAIAVSFGWPFVFLVFNLPLVVLIPLFIVTARGLPSRPHDAFPLRDYVSAFRSRELLKIGTAFACSYAAYIFYAAWTPVYLQETGITSLLFVAIISAAIPAVGILSRPFGGHLAETRFSADLRSVPAIALFFLFATSLVLPFAAGAGIPLLLVAGFLAQFPFSVYYLMSNHVMPKRFAGTAYALMNTTALVGGTVTPALAGLLRDLSGSFVPAFLMIAASSLLGLLAVWMIRLRKN